MTKSTWSKQPFDASTCLVVMVSTNMYTMAFSAAIAIVAAVAVGLVNNVVEIASKSSNREDFLTFGKIIGGGMPVAAFGGKRDIMNCVAPLGPVYQAGTLSGNPVAVACGLATLHEIQQPGFYKRLSEQTAKLVKGLGAMAKKHGVAFSAQSIGGMFGIYFRGKCPTSFKEVMECDADRFKTFFHAMLDNGVYLAPSIYEAGFVSITHDDSVIARTLEAADKAFAEVKRVHG